MNRTTYDTFYKKTMSYEEDIISQSIGLLNDQETYKAGITKEGYPVFINNQTEKDQIMAGYTSE